MKPLAQVQMSQTVKIPCPCQLQQMTVISARNILRRILPKLHLA